MLQSSQRNSLYYVKTGWEELSTTARQREHAKANLVQLEAIKKEGIEEVIEVHNNATGYLSRKIVAERLLLVHGFAVCIQNVAHVWRSRKLDKLYSKRL